MSMPEPVPVEHSLDSKEKTFQATLSAVLETGRPARSGARTIWCRTARTTLRYRIHVSDLRMCTSPVECQDCRAAASNNAQDRLRRYINSDFLPCNSNNWACPQSGCAETGCGLYHILIDPALLCRERTELALIIMHDADGSGEAEFPRTLRYGSSIFWTR